jgi:tetratricopeptide (TPR) repeat protein
MAGIHAVLDRVMVTLSSRVNPLLGKAASLAELPKSMEAYRAYIAGFESFLTGDNARARTQFYRAATLDSTFVNALTWAAIAEWSVNFNVPRVDSLLKIVERHREKLLPFDLASLDYLRAWVDGDVARAQVAARRRAALGGGRWNAFAVQGALRLNRIDEAYDYVRELMKAPLGLSGPIDWAYFGDVLHARGEHARELREVQNGIARIGDEGLFGAELRALAALGRLGEIRARIETAKSGSMSGGLGGVYQATTSQLRAHGFPAQADALARDAVEWDRRVVADSSTWRSRFDLAASLFELGDAEADTIFSALVNEGLPGSYGREHFGGYDAAALGYLGVSAARRGDTAAAERVIARLGRFQRPFLLGANTHWQARIAAQLGQCERAVQYLRAALKSGSSYLGLSETPQFAQLSCDAYKEFMKPKK